MSFNPIVTIDPTIPFPDNGSQPLSLGGIIYVLEFTGLLPGTYITSVHLQSLTSYNFQHNVSAVVYDNGGSKEWKSTPDFGFTDEDGYPGGGRYANHHGKIWVSQISGLPVGEMITHIYVDLLSNSSFSSWNAVIYSDGGGSPSAKMAQTQAFANGQGIKKLKLLSPTFVPASGSIWVGVASNAFPGFGRRTTGAGGFLADLPPGYASFSDPLPGLYPSPITSTGDEIWVAVRHTHDTTGTPGGLLGHSDWKQTSNQSIGPDHNKFVLKPPAKVPLNGIVWAGFVSQNQLTGVFPSTDSIDLTHPVNTIPKGYSGAVDVSDEITYPPGPPPGQGSIPLELIHDPFGVVDWMEPDVEKRRAFWTQIRFDPIPVTQGHVVG